MSRYYTAQRSWNLYDPARTAPFRISRSKIELFLECPRCFYLDARLGVGRPRGFPFTLNIAVDALLKKEFDIHRAAGSAHPLMEEHGVDAVPLAHEQLETWRDSLRAGVSSHHAPTNLLVTGGIDDVWVKPNGDLIVVDYKCTAKPGPVGIDAEWQGGYRRQLDVYQWLFRRNGFEVADTGYFVYCNGNVDQAVLGGRLEFEMTLVPYEGDDSWVEETLVALHACLESAMPPAPGPACDLCAYSQAADAALGFA